MKIGFYLQSYVLVKSISSWWANAYSLDGKNPNEKYMTNLSCLVRNIL